LPEITKLNSLLSDQNYPKLPKIYPSVGLGAIRFRNKLVRAINFVGYGLTNKKDSFTTSIKYLGSELSIGYCYLETRKIQVYSMVGLNFTKAFIKISGNPPSSTTFRDYTSNLGNQLELTNRQMTANISTHFAYKVTKKRSNNKNTVGMRVGYNIPFYTDWKTNDTSLKDGPKVNLSGLYAMFQVSFAMK